MDAPGDQTSGRGSHSVPSRCDVSRRREGSLRHVVTVSGELDLDVAADVTASVDHTLSEPAETIVIDLREVRFIDSGGLKALLDARQTSDAANVRLYVTNASPQVRRVADIAEVDDLLS